MKPTNEMPIGLSQILVQIRFDILSIAYAISHKVKLLAMNRNMLIIANAFLAAVLLVWAQGWWSTLKTYAEAGTTTLTAEIMLSFVYWTIITCLASLYFAWKSVDVYARRLFVAVLLLTAAQVFASLGSLLIRGFSGQQLHPVFESWFSNPTTRYYVIRVLTGISCGYFVYLVLLVFKPGIIAWIWGWLCKLCHRRVHKTDRA